MKLLFILYVAKSVMNIERKKITVENALLGSNMFLACFTGPTRNKVLDEGGERKSIIHAHKQNIMSSIPAFNNTIEGHNTRAHMC
jgi:hypothetical protein